MKILAYVHGYHPNHNAGSEAMLHQILIGLKDLGHEVIVITANPGAKSFEGIDLYDASKPQSLKLFAWADIVFTHLAYSDKAVALCKKYKKPLVSIIHNDRKLKYNLEDRKHSNLLVANSEWIRDTIHEDIPTVIVYPPTLPERYQVSNRGNAITLINISDSKGGNTFWEIARRMSNRKFIGVVGAYGKQIIHRLPNVKIINNSPEIKQVYESTRLLLIPSVYETWGRVGIEAACSGIPSIASPTPGLKESLGDCGTFVDRDDIDGYIKAINDFDNLDHYQKFSDLSVKRANEIGLLFKKQILELESSLKLIL
jgi:glycosyltransferase involved in cell wall biosynthesis